MVKKKESAKKPVTKKPGLKKKKRLKKTAPAKARTLGAKTKKSKHPKKSKLALPAEKQVPGGVFLGEVEDYFSKVGVIALTLKRSLSVGDTMRVKGHTTDITQKVESMQIEHQIVQTASEKDAVGIKVVDRARKGDAVYKL